MTTAKDDTSDTILQNVNNYTSGSSSSDVEKRFSPLRRQVSGFIKWKSSLIALDAGNVC
jgi:hypothetical protein